MDHLDFIRILLAHGAKVNARVLEGATPIVRAAQSGDIVLMKLLLDRGADPKIPTSFGDTALSAMAGIGWVEGVTHEWCRQQSAEAVKLLLDLGLNPNSANQDGRTPLMAAAHKGRTESLQLLVDHGAKLETRDKGSRDTQSSISPRMAAGRPSITRIDWCGSGCSLQMLIRNRPHSFAA